MLPAKHVFHSVAMGFNADCFGVYCECCDPGIIARSTKNALALAEEMDLHSIGFPALGTGGYNVPLDEAIRAMGHEFSSHLGNGARIERIGLILQGKEAHDIGKKIFEEIFL